MNQEFHPELAQKLVETCLSYHDVEPDSDPCMHLMAVCAVWMNSKNQAHDMVDYVYENVERANT